MGWQRWEADDPRFLWGLSVWAGGWWVDRGSASDLQDMESLEFKAAPVVDIGACCQWLSLLPVLVCPVRTG